MMRSWIVLVSLCLFATAALSGSERYQKRGFIRNDEGAQCWYTQSVDEKSTYFWEKIHGPVGDLVFDDAKCMADRGLGLDINKRMINNVISLWYSHRDANFQTSVDQLRKSSMLQKRGWCIQSKTYPAIGIVVDYVVEGESIARVLHGMSAGACE